jgi:hypothetical protein
MKNITKESIEQDLKIIQDMVFKYKEAIYESQEGQPAHFDNQSKLCRLCIGDIRCGLIIARDALNYLSGIEIIED